MSNQKLLYRIITKQMFMRVNVLIMISTETNQPTNRSRREATCKSFLHEIQRRGTLALQKRAITKVFSAKIVLFTNLQKFSPSKVSRYNLQKFSPSKVSRYNLQKFSPSKVSRYMV